MLQIHLVKSKKVKIHKIQKIPKSKISYIGILRDSKGDLGRAYLQGGSQEFGGRGGERLRSSFGLILL